MKDPRLPNNYFKDLSLNIQPKIQILIGLDYLYTHWKYVLPRLRAHFPPICAASALWPKLQKKFQKLMPSFFFDFGLWDLIMKMNYSGKKIIQQNRKCPGPKQPRFCLFTTHLQGKLTHNFWTISKKSEHCAWVIASVITLKAFKIVSR